MTPPRKTQSVRVKTDNRGTVEVRLPDEFAVYQRNAIRAQRLVIALIVLLALVLSSVEARRQSDTNKQFTQLLMTFEDSQLIHRTRNEAHPVCETEVITKALNVIVTQHKTYTERQAVKDYLDCDERVSRIVIPPTDVGGRLQFRSSPVPDDTPKPTKTPAPSRGPSAASDYQPPASIFFPAPQNAPAPTSSPPRSTSRPKPKPTPAPSPTCTVTCVPSP